MQPGEDRPKVTCKDVVIIGNGPSGMCLSYLLAGNWPHYAGAPHPGDEMLTARLRYVCSKRSDNHSIEVVDEKRPSPDHCLPILTSRDDLECLSSGLEGRNEGKPLSLLMDQLQHPCLDAGLDVDSLLSWNSIVDHREHKVIDHVVLGKGPPGGVWHALDPNVLTVSLKKWMSLPGLSFQDWESKYGTKDRTMDGEKSGRVPIGAVAEYFKDYVKEQGIEKYFICGTVVTSVRPLSNVKNSIEQYSWLVEGFHHETNEPFAYRCKRVVLATGTTDSTNSLGVTGEDTYNWVTHDFKELEKKLDYMYGPLRPRLHINQNFNLDDDKAKKEPVLIVGSGLSAADAIIAARLRGIPVLHVFRNVSKEKKSGRSDYKNKNLEKLQWLPASIYPEYHKVYEMMANESKTYSLYKALPDHFVVEFQIGTDKYTRTKTKRVTLCTPQNRLVSYRVSCAAVLIGSKPDLSYLQNGGIGLGKLPDKPIDSRSNPIDVDVFNYQVKRASRKGLYSIGPLAGDNFVRFILGGAFGVLTDILNYNTNTKT